MADSAGEHAEREMMAGHVWLVLSDFFFVSRWTKLQ